MIVDPSLTMYPFCGTFVETTSHLFATCDMINMVEYRIFKWLGWQTVIPRDPCMFFESFMFLGSYGKSMGVLSMI